MDYQDLNNLTIKNWYIFPLIGKVLDGLDQAKKFTQLNLITTYHWMKIREIDEKKMAFHIRYGHFEYQIILFGLSNVAASFRGYINKILVQKLNIFVVVYLNNNLIYTKNPNQPYIEAIQWVLK